MRTMLRMAVWRRASLTSLRGSGWASKWARDFCGIQARAAHQGVTSWRAATHPLEDWPSAIVSINKAATPPSSWYMSEAALAWERKTVFHNNWLMVGSSHLVEEPGTFFTVAPMGGSYVICRDATGELRGFHNVCRHHAAAVASGCGRAESFHCPYHGWTYALNGRLTKAPRMKGIQNFRALDYGLVPVEVACWGNLIFIRPSQHRHAEDGGAGVEHWLGDAESSMRAAGQADSHLTHVASRCYTLQCNWKVFCDNYLDGGYHVSVAHPNLAAGLDLKQYRSDIFQRASIQSCPSNPSSSQTDRLGDKEAAYTFVYPNLMINRYGPWLDTNVAWPLSPDTCRVDFHYWLEPSLSADAAYISSALADSELVQQEDVALCEGVQRGLHSPAYDIGRYAPGVEGPMFHFHQLLHNELHAAGAFLPHAAAA